MLIVTNANDCKQCQWPLYFIPSEVTNRTIADRHYIHRHFTVPNWQPDTALLGIFFMNCFLRLELGNTFFVCLCLNSLQSQLCWLVGNIFLPAPPAPRDAASPRIHVKNNSIVFQLGPALFLAAWRHRSGSWEAGGRREALDWVLTSSELGAATETFLS